MTSPAATTTPRIYSTYVPMERQALFHRITAVGPVLFKGAIGGLDGGKTTACEQELIELCNRMPGGQSIAVRLHMEGEGEITLIQDLKKLLLPGGFARWDSAFFFEFPNGHKLYCIHGKDIEKIGSLEICAAYLMEAHEMSLRFFQTVSARLRHPAAMIDGRPYYRLLFDARGVTDHHWINKEFIEKGWDVDAGEEARSRAENPNYAYVKFKTSHNTRRGAWYEQGLRDQHKGDPLWIKVYIDGDIGFDVEGEPVFSSSYDPDVHVAPEPLKTDESLYVLRGWDYGFRAPATTWVQYSREGQFRVLFENAPRNISTEALVKEAKAIQGIEWPRRATTGYQDYCDRAGDSVDSATSQRDIDIVEQGLQTVCTFRYTNREYGLSILRKLMTSTAKVNGVLQPRLIVDPRCDTVKSALGGGYFYPPKNQAAGPIKGGPYAAVIDTLRYIAQEVVEDDMQEGPPVVSTRGAAAFSGQEGAIVKELFFGR